MTAALAFRIIYYMLSCRWAGHHCVDAVLLADRTSQEPAGWLEEIDAVMNTTTAARLNLCARGGQGSAADKLATFRWLLWC